MILIAPLLTAALISYTVRVFARFPDLDGGHEREWLKEVGWSWLPLCIPGLSGVLFCGRSAPRARLGIAMFFLVPLWGLALAAVHWGAAGAQKAVAISTPVSPEFNALGSIGEISGVYVLAFAWSAAFSLCCAYSTFRGGRRGEVGLAASLALTGLSFVAATLQAGSIRLALTVGLRDIELLRRAAKDTSDMGTLAGGMMLAAVCVGILATWKPLESRQRLI